MTIEYFQNVEKMHLLARMERINRYFPLDLNDLFLKKLTAFNSWGGDWILTPESGHRRWEPPYNNIFGTKGKPHITLARMPGRWIGMIKPEELNWEHGLLVDQVHAGFKVDGEMKYFTSSELARYNPNER